jgi:hypothetical protein
MEKVEDISEEQEGEAPEDGSDSAKTNDETNSKNTA